MSSEDNNEVSSGQEEPKKITLKIKLPLCVSQQEIEAETHYNETLADLRETINISMLTSNLTNFDIFYTDVNLSETFEDLLPFEEIFTSLNVAEPEGLVLRLAEKPYNLAAAHEQIRKFREVIGLHYLERLSTSFGMLNGPTKFNNLDLGEVAGSEKKSDDSTTDKGSGEDLKNNDTAAPFSGEEKEVITGVCESLADFSEESLSRYGKFNSAVKELKSPIKSLTISQWFPVPPMQKASGDLLYLTLQTVENETYNITCHITGFFVNRCSNVNFNPAIKKSENGKSQKDYLLINLVDSLSPSFSKIISENEVALSKYSGFAESYLIPSNSFLSSPWVVDVEDVSFQPDLSRAQVPLFTNGVDGADFVKEWNEDYQSIRELPSETFNEKILREKLLNKLIFEFKEVSTRTAIEILNGNLMPLNANEPKQLHIFLRNGIFYSFGVNATGAFDNTGDNEAARYAASKDLTSIKLLNKIDVKGIYNLMTCVVDYMGKRIVCQAPVPGIFQDSFDDGNSEPKDKVCYGLNIDNSKFSIDHSFDEPLKTVAEFFHLQPHTVDLGEGLKSEEETLISKDIKGIKGSDNRKYLIDLYRTTPLDINFIEENWNPSDGTAYPHRESVVRHEAVEEWWKRKAAVLMKMETEKLEKDGKLDGNDEAGKPQIVLAANAVSFNADAFNTINEKEADKEKVREISTFVREILISEFLSDISKQVAPFDGHHLTSNLHKSGISMRYLGYIADQCNIKIEEHISQEKEQIKENLEIISLAAKEGEDGKDDKKDDKGDSDSAETNGESENSQDEDKEEMTKGEFEPVIANLGSLFRICLQEMVSRSVKHLLRKLSVDLPVYLMKSFVSHFHNCLFGIDIVPNPPVVIEEPLQSLCSTKNLEFVDLDSKTVHHMIEEEVFLRYRFRLPENWFSEVPKQQLFREIALKFGIQWKAFDYKFDKNEFEDELKMSIEREAEALKSKKKSSKKRHQNETPSAVRSTIFVAEDLISFIPLVKDSSFKSSFFDDMFEAARIQTINGDEETSVALLSNLLSIYEQVYGTVHPETSRFYGILAQYYSELGRTSEACKMARKSCILSERTLGFDSYETLTAYINTAYFESMNNNVLGSLKLYNKVIKDWNQVYGPNHPSLVNTYANLAEYLFERKLYKMSFRLFENALSISKSINGENSQITGMLKYRFAGSLLGDRNFERALAEFESASKIFNEIIGPNDVLSQRTATFVSNIRTYLAYQENQKKGLFKKQSSQKMSGNGKAKSKIVSEAVGPRSRKGKKANVLPDPEIASQSVEDILKYIESGSSKPKPGKITGK